VSDVPLLLIDGYALPVIVRNPTSATAQLRGADVFCRYRGLPRDSLVIQIRRNCRCYQGTLRERGTGQAGRTVAIALSSCRLARGSWRPSGSSFSSQSWQC
jgi:hypothetical protein